MLFIDKDKTNSSDFNIPSANTLSELKIEFIDYVKVEERIKQRPDLTFIAETLLDNMALTLNTDNTIVTDEDGYILFLRNNTSKNLCPAVTTGACLSVDSVGNNSFGKAIKENNTYRMSEEHPVLLKNYISFAVPIEKNGEVIGSAGFIHILDEDSRPSDMIIETIFKTSVTAALKMLEARKLSDEIYLIKSTVDTHSSYKAFIIVNADYIIVDLNNDAKSILNITSKDMISKPITHLLENDNLSSFKNELINQKLLFKTSEVIPTHTYICPIYNENRLIGWRIEFEKILNISAFSTSAKSLFTFADIIGSNKKFMQSIRLAKAIAASPSNVLITGESGTGKELFAQSIHSASLYKNGPFIALNCAAIPEELMESELFGYTEGAFTGAKKKGMIGKFVKANGGTIFLDEIGDMPLKLQAKLLKVIQDRQVTPLGTDEPIPIDVRIITATNQNLQDLVAEKTFRLDLFYRINVINIHIIPLRERKDDLSELINYFVRKHCSRLNKEITSIADVVYDFLATYDWPGNVRELENVMELAVNLAESEVLLEHLPLMLKKGISSLGSNYDNFEDSLGSIKPLDDVITDIEKREILKALKHFNGNISHAANALNIGRTTLYRKIEKFNLIDYLK